MVSILKNKFLKIMERGFIFFLFMLMIVEVSMIEKYVVS